MPSTYSSNLKIELMSTGENSGTWGNITNTNLGTALEQAVVGYGAVSYASDANLTISITNSNAAQAARALVLNVTSAVSLTGTRELVVPTIEKQYIVQNNTTGSQSITVKTSAGTGITVPNGRKAHLYVNGTDVIQMFDFVDINGGAIDGTTIGAASASTGAFTTLNASGATTLDGNVTLGNASGDNITFTGTITSNLLFTDNTYDIGASGATRPRNLFLAGAATIGGNLSVGGTLTLTGGLILNGNVTVGDTSADTLTINATITSNLLFTDNTYDIGASGATRPRNLFLAGNITAGGNQTLTGSLTVDSTTDSSSTTTGSIQTDGGLGVAKALYVGTTANIAGAVTLSGGTANGVAYLNGSKVLTTGSALTFDGTEFKVNAASGNVLIQPSNVANAKLYMRHGSIANNNGFEVDVSSNTIFLQAGSEQMRLTSTGLTVQQGAVFNESGADSDFRVESDTNTHAIFLDAASSEVGINVSDPLAPLHVFNGSTNAVVLQLSGGSAYTAGTGPKLVFQNGLAGGEQLAGVQGSFDQASNGNYGRLSLLTRTSDALGIEEKVRIGSDGAFTTLPKINGAAIFNSAQVDADFSVRSVNNAYMLFVDGGNNRVVVGASQWGVSTAPFQANNIAITDTGSAHHILIGNQDSGGTNLPSMIRGVNGTLHLGWGNDWADAAGGTMTQAFSVVGSSPSVVVNDDGADIDFRVESDTSTHMLFVDAGDNSVNINTNTPFGGKLNVNGAIVTDSNHRVHIALPSFLFGAGGVTDEYWVVARRYVGSLIAASGLSGTITGSRGSTGTGNVLARQDVNILSAYNVNSIVGLNSLGNEANFVAVDIISISGVEYYALRARPSGGDCDNGLYFEGFMVNNTGDTNVFTRVRSSTAGVSVVTTNVGLVNSWFTGDTYLEASRAGYSRVLINGTETVVNDSGLDYDFRVESDANTHMLFVDAGNNRVGINNQNPTATLDVTGYSSFRKSGSSADAVPAGGFFTEDTAYGIIFMPRAASGNYNANVQTNDSVVFATPQYNPLFLAVHDGSGIRITQTSIVLWGNTTVNGSLSKSSGSFRIDHPLPELEATHQLVHSFVEAPQADLYYRGKVALVNGRATVNIDQAAGMTEGTFVVLCRDVQCFTSNETDWDAVRGSVSGNILTIECQNASSTATISWLVIGERQDKHMMDTEWTDENGKVIVEPLKPEPAAH